MAVVGAEVTVMDADVFSAAWDRAVADHARILALPTDDPEHVAYIAHQDAFLRSVTTGLRDEERDAPSYTKWQRDNEDEHMRYDW